MEEFDSINIPTLKLNNGQEIPVLGYGTWVGLDDKLECLFSDIPKLVDALSYAIDIGYRHIDTAHLYRIEPEIGQLLAKKIKDGVVKREEVFVTTKKDGVDEKIDYLDTWRGFESVLRMGLVKSIGVSNLNVEQMKRLLDKCQVPPVCNQIQVNLNLSEKELVNFCQANNVAVVAYSPFGSIFPGKGPADSPEPKIDSPTLVTIAKKHGKTVTQVVLRYLHQRNIIVIPKTLTKSRALENAQIFDFKLSEIDNMELAKFDNGYRFLRPDIFQKYTYYPFTKVSGIKDVEVPLSLLQWKNGANGDVE